MGASRNAGDALARGNAIMERGSGKRLRGRIATKTNNLLNSSARHISHFNILSFSVISVAMKSLTSDRSAKLARGSTSGLYVLKS